MLKRRISIGVVAGMLLAMAGIAPAAAQSFDGEVLLSQPSADALCDLLGELGDLAELEEAFGGMEGLEAFEPEQVDDAEYADLNDAMQTLLDDHEDAMAITAATDGQMLAITVTPDLSDCEAYTDLEDQGQELGSGTFLIQPSVEEYCGLLEDTFEEFEDLEDEAMEDLDEDAMGDDPAADEDALDEDALAEGLEGFLPEPVGDEDRAQYEPVGAALTALLDGADDADEASASSDGESLVVALVPGIERCDVLDDETPVSVDEEEVAEEIDDEVEEEIEVPTEVPSGLGVSATGTSTPFVLGLVGLLLLAFGGALSVRGSRG